MPTPLKYSLPPLQLDTNDTVGQRIAKMRKRRGLTQTALAQTIGITQSVVSDYEVGRARLSDEMLIRFALALKTSADYLLGLKDDVVVEPISRSLAQKMQEIEKLPNHEKRSLMKNIDMFLKGAHSDD